MRRVLCLSIVVTLVLQFSQANQQDPKYSLTWTSNDNYTTFTFAASIVDADPQSAWIAFGFSKDKSMGDDDVVMCKNFKSISLIEHYRNEGKYMPQLLDGTRPLLGLSSMQLSILGNRITCSVSRAKSIANMPNYFDLGNGNKYYILMAYGPIDQNNFLGYHKNKIISEIPYSFEQASDMTSTSIITTKTTTTAAELPTPPQLSLLKVAPQRGGLRLSAAPYTSVGSYGDNTFMVNWKDTQDATEFTLETTLDGIDPNKAWTAFAFSKDQQMGDDDVTMCISNGATKSVLHYVNVVRTPTPQATPPVEQLYTSRELNATNNKLICKVRRVKTLNSDANFVYDIDQGNLYLFTAYGPLKATGEPAIHKTRKMSASSINFASNATFTSSSTKQNLSKSHGCIMVFAWMFMASTGILLARYYKYLFPGQVFCGVQFWFTVHRPLMITVSAFSIAGLIVILFRAQWQWVETDEPLEFTHSIFGIVTISFAFFQVLMGFLRPDKTHKYRFIFNWLHRSLGVCAFVFSIVAIILGVLMDQMHLGRVGWCIMIGWVVWVIILPLFIEILGLFLTSHDKSDVYHLDATNGKEKQEIGEHAREKYRKIFESIKSFLLPFHLLVALGLSVALIVVIAVADENTFQ